MKKLTFKRINNIHFIEHPYTINSYFKAFESLFNSLYNNNLLFFGIEFKIPSYVKKNERVIYIDKVIFSILNKIELIEFSYLTIIKKKIYVLFSIRSIIGLNSQLIDNLYNYFIFFPNKLTSINIISLNNKKKILLFFKKITNCELQNHYFNIHSNSNIIFPRLYSFVSEVNLYTFYEIPNRIEVKINEYSELRGYHDSIYSKYTIVYLFNLYLHLNNLNVGIYNDQLILYKEDINNNYKISIYNFASILIDEFKEICLFLKEKFYIQLDNVDLYNKSLPLLNDAFEIFKINSLRSYNINNNYIEFKDGIYIFNQNNFLSKNENILDSNNIKVFLFFNEIFQDILNDNLLIIDVKNKIIGCCSSIFNKEKYLNSLFTKIFCFINNKEFIYNDMYNNSNQLNIIETIESFLNKIIKKNQYKIVLEIICPFLIAFKLYCISFFLKENSFDKLVENTNNFYKLNKINSRYCPLITQFHKENFIKFIIQINNLYKNNDINI